MVDILISEDPASSGIGCFSTSVSRAVRKLGPSAARCIACVEDSATEPLSGRNVLFLLVLGRLSLRSGEGSRSFGDAGEVVVDLRFLLFVARLSTSISLDLSNKFQALSSS